MSGTTISSEGLDPRRRRLKFRMWHRGLREMDLVFGGFADAELASLADADLFEVECWLNVPDQQMLAWVTGAEIPPEDINTPLFGRLRSSHVRDLKT